MRTVGQTITVLRSQWPATTPQSYDLPVYIRARALGVRRAHPPTNCESLTPFREALFALDRIVMTRNDHLTRASCLFRPCRSPQVTSTTSSLPGVRLGTPPSAGTIKNRTRMSPLYDREKKWPPQQQSALPARAGQLSTTARLNRPDQAQCGSRWTRGERPCSHLYTDHWSFYEAEPQYQPAPDCPIVSFPVYVLACKAIRHVQ